MFTELDSHSSQTFIGEDGSASNATGSQSSVWWNQKDGRRTHIHYTNTADGITQSEQLGDAFPLDCGFPDELNPFCQPLNLSVHVQILDENCLEIRDFCDSYTPFDSHVYDLGNLITNTGQKISDSILQGREGTFIITHVVACDDDDRAIEFDFGFGSMRMLDDVTGGDDFDYDYGVSMWVRSAIADNCLCNLNDTRSLCGNTLSGLGGEATILGCSGQGPQGCTGVGIQNGCELNFNTPQELSQNFSTLTISTAARSDVVVMNYLDLYNFFNPLAGYVALPAQKSISLMSSELMKQGKVVDSSKHVLAG